MHRLPLGLLVAHPRVQHRQAAPARCLLWGRPEHTLIAFARLGGSCTATRLARAQTTVRRSTSAGPGPGALCDRFWGFLCFRCLLLLPDRTSKGLSRHPCRRLQLRPAARHPVPLRFVGFLVVFQRLAPPPHPAVRLPAEQRPTASSAPCCNQARATASRCGTQCPRSSRRASTTSSTSPAGTSRCAPTNRAVALSGCLPSGWKPMALRARLGTAAQPLLVPGDPLCQAEWRAVELYRGAKARSAG